MPQANTVFETGDCHVVAALRELALEAAANALRLVDPPADKLPKHVVFRDDPDTVVKADPLAFLNEDEEMTATPLFRVEVAFVDSELQLSPSKEAMQLCFNDVLQSVSASGGHSRPHFCAPGSGAVRDDGRRRGAHGEQREEITVQDLVGREPAWRQLLPRYCRRLSENF